MGAEQTGFSSEEHIVVVSQGKRRMNQRPIMKAKMIQGKKLKSGEVDYQRKVCGLLCAHVRGSKRGGGNKKNEGGENILECTSDHNPVET